MRRSFFAPLLFLGLVAVGLLSFLWLKRAVSSIRVDRLLRFVLIIFFGCTIACALLHFLWLSLLPFAFIMLMGAFSWLFRWSVSGEARDLARLVEERERKLMFCL